MAVGGKGGGGKGGGGKGSAAPSGYSGEQVAVAKAMADAMSKIQASSAALESSFTTQADGLAKLSGSMKEFASEGTAANLTKIGEAFKTICDAINCIDATKLQALTSVSTSAQGSITALSAQIEELSKRINAVPTKNLSNSTTQLGSAAGKSSKSLGQLSGSISGKAPQAAGIFAGAIDGLTQGFRNIMAIGSSVTGVIGSLVGGLFEIGKSILAIPFKLFNGLIEMAGAGGGGISELAQAINNIRKEFGHLSGPMATTIQQGAKSMKGFSDTGLSATAVFGNVAERMEKLTALAAAAGPAFHNLRNSMDIGHLMGYQRGLGISDEQMGDLALRAQSTGQPLDKMFQNVTKQALGLGKAFDIDAKTISKGMAKAMQNVKAFGNVSEESIGQAVVYARKLGIDIDKMTASLDNFATFDAAADNVSKLNEAFGTNIDAMELLNAETPADQMQILRDAMKSAGIEGEKLTRAQRALIQQTTGWDDATSIAALSTKNYGVSLSDIKKKSEDASKKELTNAQAMSKLADAMERTLKAGEAMQGGFFAQFLRGFGDGIKMSHEFRGVMMAIRQSLIVVYRAGRELGLMFVKMFPGVRDILGGLKDGFAPAKFRKLMKDVLGVFKDFFNDLSGPNGKASFPKLMDSLKDKFFNFFNGQTGAGSKMLDGFKKFGTAIINIFAGMIKWVSAKLTDFIRLIVDFIKNPEMPKVSGDLGFLAPIIDAFSDAWPPLWAALKDLFGILFDKLKNWMKTDGMALLKDIGPYIAAIMFGPALVKSFLGGLTGALGSAIGKMFTGGGAGGKSLESALGKLNQSIGKLGSAGKSAAPPVPSMSPQQIKDLKMMEVKVAWSKVMQFLVGFAGVIAIGLLGFYAAIKIVEGVKAEDVASAIAAMIGVGITAKLLGPVFQQIQNTKKFDKTKIFGFLGLLAGTLAIGLLAMVGMIELVQAYNPTPAQLAMMLGITVVMGVLLTVGAGIAFIASKLSKLGKGAIKEVGIGMLILGIAVGGIMLAAWGMMELLESYGTVKAEQIMAMAMLLDAISDAFLIAIPIVLASAGIGAAIISSGGIVAAAMAVGFPILVGAVVGMAGVAADLLSQLSTIPGDPAALKTKAEAFSMLMNGVTDMMAKMGEILEIVSDMTSWFDTPEENQAIITKMTEFAQAILGKGGKEGGGIQGVIATLIDGMQNITADKVGPMQAMGAILGSVGTVIAAVGKSMSDFQDNTESTWEALFGQDPEKIKTNMKTGQDYMSTVLTSVSGMITAIMDSFAGFSASDAAAIEKMGGPIGTILQAFTGLMKAVVPDPNSFKEEMGAAVEESVLFGAAAVKADTSAKTVNTGAMKMMLDHITGIIGVMAEKLPDLISGIAGGFVNAVNQLTPEKAKFIEPLAKVLETVTKLVIALMPKPDMPKPPDPSKVAAGASVVYNLTQSFPDIGRTLTSLKDKLPELLDVLVAGAQKLGKLKAQGIESNINLLIKVLDILPKLVEMTKTVSSAIGNKEAGELDPNAGLTLANTFRHLKYFLQFLFFGKAEGAAYQGSYDPQLVKIIEIFNNEDVKKSLNLASIVQPSVNRLVTMVDALSKLATATKNISSTFPDVPGESVGITLANNFRYLKYFLQLILEGKATGGAYTGSYDKQLLEIVKTLENSKETINKAGALQGYTANLVKMFNSMKSLVEAVNELSSSMPTSKGEMTAAELGAPYLLVAKFISWLFREPNSLGTVVKTLTDNSGVITAGAGQVASINSLKSVIINLATFGREVGTALAAFNTANVNLDATGLFNQLGKFGTSLKGNADQAAKDLTSDVANIEKVTLKSYAKAAQVVGELVDTGFRLSNSLSRGARIDLGAKLRMYTSNYGKFLGSGGSYSVTSKDVVINVNFKIAIDGQQVEKMMISTGKSVIRQRINLLLEAVKDGRDTSTHMAKSAKAPAGSGVPESNINDLGKPGAERVSNNELVTAALNDDSPADMSSAFGIAKNIAK
jgi:hypothetical protein